MKLPLLAVEWARATYAPVETVPQIVRQFGWRCISLLAATAVLFVIFGAMAAVAAGFWWIAALVIVLLLSLALLMQRIYASQGRSVAQEKSRSDDCKATVVASKRISQTELAER